VGVRARAAIRSRLTKRDEWIRVKGFMAGFISILLIQGSLRKR